jgi:hypothetical protein
MCLGGAGGAATGRGGGAGGLATGAGGGAGARTTGAGGGGAAGLGGAAGMRPQDGHPPGWAGQKVIELIISKQDSARVPSTFNACMTASNLGGRS